MSDVNSKYQNYTVTAKLKWFFQQCFFLIILCISFVAGCQSAGDKKQLLEQIEQLNKQNTQLASRVEQSEAENEKLKGQVQVLSGLPENIKGQNLYNLREVSIHRYTNIIDSDNDGRKESLVVYIQPIDNDGSKIKAAGEVDVQLWDLDKPQDKALLGQWHIDPQQLQKLWTDFLVINYRLKFDISGLLDEFKKPLTVKIRFTDYLTGKVFQDQKVIKP